MIELAATILALFSVLIPTKMWYQPDEPIIVRIDHKAAVELRLTDFLGRRQQATAAVIVQPGGEIDLLKTFAPLTVGTYIVTALDASTRDASTRDATTRDVGARPGTSIGTPLVMSVIGDTRGGANPSKPMVVNVRPLLAAIIETPKGNLTVAFYFDKAPNTVLNFEQLAMGGFYDGITFHRVVPGFVVQAGDPLGDGTGGPGYQIDAEFNPRPHIKGVLSMARQGDPMERAGSAPRPEFADSASSQFFICIDYAKTQRLDGRYTAFAQVVEGMDVLDKLQENPVADAATGRPVKPDVISRVRIVPVTPEFNPYPKLLEILSTPATRPAE